MFCAWHLQISHTIEGWTHNKCWIMNCFIRIEFSYQDSGYPYDAVMYFLTMVPSRTTGSNIIMSINSIHDLSIYVFFRHFHLHTNRFIPWFKTHWSNLISTADVTVLTFCNLIQLQHGCATVDGSLKSGKLTS